MFYLVTTQCIELKLLSFIKANSIPYLAAETSVVALEGAVVVDGAAVGRAVSGVVLLVLQDAALVRTAHVVLAAPLSIKRNGKWNMMISYDTLLLS